MNCTTCAAPLEPGILFCPNCGTRVQDGSSAGTPTVGLSPVDGAPTPPVLTQPYEPAVAPQWAAPGQAMYGPISPPNSTAALVSLIAGILSWIVFPVIGPIIAVVAGHMARNQIRASNGQLGGNGMALAGMILGYLQIALLILAVCAFVALFIIGSNVSHVSP
jgi:hypothetical protein